MGFVDRLVDVGARRTCGPTMFWWGGLLDEPWVFHRGAGVSYLGGGYSGARRLLLGDDVVVEWAQHHDVVHADGAARLPLVCFVGFEVGELGATCACLQCCPALVVVP